VFTIVIKLIFHQAREYSGAALGTFFKFSKVVELMASHQPTVDGREFRRARIGSGGIIVPVSLEKVELKMDSPKASETRRSQSFTVFMLALSLMLLEFYLVSMSRKRVLLSKSSATYDVKCHFNFRLMTCSHGCVVHTLKINGEVKAMCSPCSNEDEECLRKDISQISLVLED